MSKLDNDKFIEGQNAYKRGVGLRAIIEISDALNAEDKEFSLVLGYLDGVIASIRRIDNLLLMPKGPDG